MRANELNPAFRYRLQSPRQPITSVFEQQEINRHSRAHVVKAANLATFILKSSCDFFIHSKLGLVLMIEVSRASCQRFGGELI